jgi:hypothetical protein
MADTPRPLDARVAEWLDTQGYPLEMRVARAFRGSRFRVIQSEYYSDPETKSSREIDVIASLDAAGKDYLLRVTFVVECKMSRDKPWILFTGTSRGLADPARVAQRASNGLGGRLLMALGKEKAAQDLEIFGLHGRPAHGVTQAFTSGTDAAFAALHGAAKATAALASHRGGSSVPFLQVFFPVVVIEGRIFEYYLADTDEPTVEEVGEGTLLWRNPVVDEPHTIVDIVTLSALPGYVARAARACESLFTQSGEACRAVIAAARAPRRSVRSPGIGWVNSWRE